MEFCMDKQYSVSVISPKTGKWQTLNRKQKTKQVNDKKENYS